MSRLTDEQINAIYQRLNRSPAGRLVYEFARAIESAVHLNPSDDQSGADGKGVQPPDGTTERDAARWRWMRDHAADSDHIVFSFNNGRESFGLIGLAAEAYIDAAMSEAVCAEPSMSTTSPSADSGTNPDYRCAHCGKQEPGWDEYSRKRGWRWNGTVKQYHCREAAIDD